MEDAPKLLKIPKSECPDIWIRLPRHKWPKSWSSMEDPVVPLERNLHGHPWAGLLWKRQFEKILLQYGWEKVSNWECLFVHRQKRVILICVCGWHKIRWKETKHWSDAEITQQRSRFGRTNIFPWSCILGMHSKTVWNKQRYCGQLKNHVWSRFFAGGTEKLPYSVNFSIISSWSYEMEGHAKKCVERYWELANKTTQQLYKVSTLCIDDHHFKEKEMKSVGELSQVCSRIVLKCLYLARIGRPGFLWSVNKLARSITKWTKACDKRLNRLISYIHHICEHKQYCYVGNTAQQCRLGLFQDFDFAGDLEDSKSSSGGTLCIFGSHALVPLSWMCKKQTSVSHSSTESEIISLDAGLWLDGILALDSWDLIVSVLGNTIQTPERPGRPFVNDKQVQSANKRSQGTTNVLKNIDCVPSNVQFSHQEALLYVFEDNEAVIKMIIKGRSPTMRHVSKTHRVALVWLFDRMNLDPKIQIKYIDTKNPTCRHSNQRKFYTWRMESSVVFVQYQPFHFCSVLWYNGETISTRFRRRTSHSKIKTYDEFNCDDAVARVVFDFSKPGEEKLWKFKSLEYECWERGKTGETRCRQRPKDRIWLLSWTIYWKFFLSKLLKVGW